MNLLLDTHVFLWWDQPHSPLLPGVRMVLEDPANTIFVSAATIGKSRSSVDWASSIFHGSAATAIAANGFLELPILPDRGGGGREPGLRHGDPFDRVLVAQAMHHGFVLVTADATIRDFNIVPQIWAGKISDGNISAGTGNQDAIG